MDTEDSAGPLSSPSRKSSYKDILNRSSSCVRPPPPQITGTWAGKAESADSASVRPEVSPRRDSRRGLPGSIPRLVAKATWCRCSRARCAFSKRTDKADDCATWWQHAVRPSLSRQFADAREWTGLGANGGPHSLQDVSSQAHTYLLSEFCIFFVKAARAGGLKGFRFFDLQRRHWAFSCEPKTPLKSARLPAVGCKRGQGELPRA